MTHPRYAREKALGTWAKAQREYVSQHDAFRAGWDARESEVKALREALAGLVPEYGYSLAIDRARAALAATGSPPAAEPIPFEDLAAGKFRWERAAPPPAAEHLCWRSLDDQVVPESRCPACRAEAAPPPAAWHRHDGLTSKECQRCIAEDNDGLPED